MKNTSKSLWHKPEMIVLVRSNPEENVLSGCKISGSLGPPNQGGGQAACDQGPAGQYQAINQT